MSGVAFGLAAYVTWGFFPLFFRQLAHLSPMDVLCNRAAWCYVFVAVLLTVTRRWERVLAAVRRPRRLALMALASLLIGGNWLIFLYALDSRQVVASSLGYFLTPLLNVLLGLAVLKERLNRKEWVSVVLAMAAVANEIIVLGALPWISLALAATFGLYGLVRKQAPIDAVSGLWLETLFMLPVAGVYALWQSHTGHPVFSGHDVSTVLLLIFAGVLTALPLMAFAAAAQRLNLATVGMLMYINPTLQFATAVWLFGEPMQPARLITFGLIWIGLAIYSWSAWEKYRRRV